ncbi:hypothetical protein TWF225_002429 [Orbilia oligospora]|uniref:Uncharacterized protein n=3 Tax=Orbilia oligospora TaxID=2813651 RepID=G1X6J6_ARTOA|nr:hypothetical protein AOL_s00054g490 [Orbilia oligospora ATCC 24927]KAF3162448.1 hypothetical protein TWF225_002429 [Orbilia oligospora]EGX51221.1 hypothetical protein AOL_s00054g490 [Orbilia oligospora ATCC 24927]KAF3242369.1 hypothetical protein TWF217_011793 [Orbilia oligospora]KAF3245987.1 hypothetical protein TWF128_009326 [Orbilia oligospora]KAF3279748.1 hypothetical protein TWF970_003783 [Orbilia oligospora]
MATTLLNLPSTPSNAGDTGSDPGTPASGISTLSTTAIKDGHEGHHPHMNMDVAAERVARLGGIGAPPNHSTFNAPTKDYFESPSVPHTPGSASVISSLADEHGSLEGEASGPNSTQAKRETMAYLARRQLEQQQQQQPIPTISTIAPNNTIATTNNVSTIAPAVSPLPRVSNAPDGIVIPNYGYSSNASRSTDSPASNQTTPSAAEARVDAKMIDGMTYDEGDTTAEGLGRRDTIRPGQIPPGLLKDNSEMDG